ncbi:MAG TPA: endolytic transglycosylase MltG [Sedimentibacter sp.]|nr:endolytic transglycosylase MltG [Sedimentibacter sp.]HOH69281.1 endolytic transglycosylase MltG [Sedimentibacter sp.]
MKKIIALLCVLVIIAAAYLYLNNYIVESLTAVDINDKTAITVEIPSGSTTNDIAEILFENNLISNIRTFKYYAERTGSDSKLKAGSYVLSRNMNADELLDSLIKGGSSGNTYNITIIEGLTNEDMAQVLSEQTGLSYDKFIELMEAPETFREDYEFLNDTSVSNLQGYLMPDTYNIYIDSSEEDIIRVLLKQFDEFYLDEIKPRMGNTGLSFEEVINLASIVEKEALLDEERDEVAKVFLNRLDINMKLQSCATVNYANGEWKERLTYEDIEIDSPYNTYIVEGLPPAPINSPGRVSIISVLEPADVDYLFFVAKGDGSHYFSNTYDEHIDAAEEYLN